MKEKRYKVCRRATLHRLNVLHKPAIQLDPVACHNVASPMSFSSKCNFCPLTISQHPFTHQNSLEFSLRCQPEQGPLLLFFRSLSSVTEFDKTVDAHQPRPSLDFDLRRLCNDPLAVPRRQMHQSQIAYDAATSFYVLLFFCGRGSVG